MESDATRALGAELRRLRLTEGLSLRAMARRLGLRAHSALVDYERGQRVPPPSALAAYARIAGSDLTTLRDLRVAAMRAQVSMRSGDSPAQPRVPAEQSPGGLGAAVLLSAAWLLSRCAEMCVAAAGRAHRNMGPRA
ncbi:helix-turn-helix domain-containing protein [Actinokineospora enzanensis]|uniref:helix-turn-helix domain-containing protein n=1 Tax=Actinokineospora enzanensis TaxID=155975 RepID=UPI00035C3CA8|nr:helix-turn-helix transcriptional regulator [Actinokineospora enzanensis]